jgi:hypothetical protein
MLLKHGEAPSLSSQVETNEVTDHVVAGEVAIVSKGRLPCKKIQAPTAPVCSPSKWHPFVGGGRKKKKIMKPCKGSLTVPMFHPTIKWRPFVANSRKKKKTVKPFKGGLAVPMFHPTAKWRPFVADNKKASSETAATAKAKTQRPSFHGHPGPQPKRTKVARAFVGGGRKKKKIMKPCKGSLTVPMFHPTIKWCPFVADSRKKKKTVKPFKGGLAVPMFHPTAKWRPFVTDKKRPAQKLLPLQKPKPSAPVFMATHAPNPREPKLQEPCSRQGWHWPHPQGAHSL